MPTTPLSAFPGNWEPDAHMPATDPAQLARALSDPSLSLIFVPTPEGPGLAIGGRVGATDRGYPISAILRACPAQSLGDPAFRRAHGLEYAYVTGAMANGIASAEIVEAMARAGMLGFFGAAGLSQPRVEENIRRIQRNIPDLPYGFNLIHSPNEPAHELAIAELYLKYRVTRVEASAYLDLTLPIVLYRLSGIREEADGRIVVPNRVMGKISRVEVATRFLSPAPEKYVAELVRMGRLTAEQAEMAKRVPMADDLTCEADSGGHTDNRPAIALLPTIVALRDRLQTKFRYAQPVRVGLGGGIATPASAAGAFAMGAAYVVTGSINQACVESGSSDIVREMLSQAEQADVAMAPAADMFEMGVKVQVLKRGTMFPQRAMKLYEAYRAYSSAEAIPTAEREIIEKTILRRSIEEVWVETREFFSRRDPSQIARAEADPRHKLALVFRWYLGLSSRWANGGDATRRLDYQVWCGPSMGAFNEWTKGTFLAAPARRQVVAVAKSLMRGAAVVLREFSLRQQGVWLPSDLFHTAPIEEIAD